MSIYTVLDKFSVQTDENLFHRHHSAHIPQPNWPNFTVSVKTLCTWGGAHGREYTLYFTDTAERKNPGLRENGLSRLRQKGNRDKHAHMKESL